MRETENEFKDVIIIGAGFAGLGMLHRVRQLNLSARVYERATNVGGTWYWNSYPGARCDVESLDYQFAFSDTLQRGWRWNERFAEQKEILAYLNYVADSLNLRNDIQFKTSVEKAVFCETKKIWQVVTDSGETTNATYLISAVGCLSTPSMPKLPGLSSYVGRWYHTGNWPQQDMDFSGLNVGVIGTGSSGIQIIPELAKQAQSVMVFQRSPNFSVPANNHRHTKTFTDEYYDSFLAKREQASRTTYGNANWSSYPSALDVTDQRRNEIYEEYWNKGGAGFMVSFADVLTNPKSNEFAADFIRGKIDSIVKDKALANILHPTDHAVGTKRICVDTNYYETFNKENVTLVDVRQCPIQSITKTGLLTLDDSYDLDVLIFATGFDAITGTLMRIDIRGRGGMKLSNKWAKSPNNFLGLSVAGFPNFFVITGPGSPSVLSNMVLSIEQHVEWIARCISFVAEQGAKCIEATEPAEKAWVAHVNEIAQQTLFPKNNSWYLGSNIGGKARVFMPYVGGIGQYRKRCEKVVKDGYTGFKVS